MQALRSIFERMAAAVTFFTRLPAPRGMNVGAQAHKGVVPLWPLAGWLTGGVMVGLLLLARRVGLGVEASVIVALAGRMLLTGALHEDGLADFCDGFGGGRTRQRTLEIMKDSHIGTFGVLGLVGYCLLMVSLLTGLMTRGVSPLILIGVDAVCKFLASTIVWFLPYARKEADAKNRLTYTVTPTGEKVLSLFWGILPLALMMIFLPHMPSLVSVVAGVLFAGCVCSGLFLLMHKRIGGYTGDCCGAAFLLAELAFYLMLTLIF